MPPSSGLHPYGANPGGSLSRASSAVRVSKMSAYQAPFSPSDSSAAKTPAAHLPCAPSARPAASRATADPRRRRASQVSPRWLGGSVWKATQRGVSGAERSCWGVMLSWQPIPLQHYSAHSVSELPITVAVALDQAAQPPAAYRHAASHLNPSVVSAGAPQAWQAPNQGAPNRTVANTR